MNSDLTNDVLLQGAYDIAKQWDNNIVKKNDNKHIFTGIFLKALLDNASPRPIHPGEEPDYYTGIRYTAAVIRAAYAERKVREVAEAWLDYMVYPSEWVCLWLRCYLSSVFVVKAAGYHRTTQSSTGQTSGIEDMVTNVESSSQSGQAMLRRAVRVWPSRPLSMRYIYCFRFSQETIIVASSTVMSWIVTSRTMTTHLTWRSHISCPSLWTLLMVKIQHLL